MSNQEAWSEWMWLAMGAAAIVVVSLVIWVIVLAFGMLSRRQLDTDTERALHERFARGNNEAAEDELQRRRPRR